MKIDGAQVRSRWRRFIGLVGWGPFIVWSVWVLCLVAVTVWMGVSR